MSINNSQQISDIKTMLVKGMNGEGIESIEKTATEGFIDTYTITYTDGTKTTFDVTNGNWGIWTSAVTAAQGATSVTINNDSIVPTSILEVFSQNASGTVITVNDIDVTPGTAVLTFPALAETTSFIIHVINGTASGGGGGGGTSDYPDLTNKPQINGVTLVGNKPSSDFGLQNIFQGTIAEWNQLTTAEKKAYDHASIPDSLDGNVTFPASKVMLNSGDSVEEKIGNVRMAKLWENSAPTATFAAQNITLSDGDYDLLIAIARSHKDYANSVSVVFIKNSNGVLIATAGTNLHNAQRTITYSSGNVYAVSDALEGGTSGTTTNNDRIIPTVIYGIKLT